MPLRKFTIIKIFDKLSKTIEDINEILDNDAVQQQDDAATDDVICTNTIPVTIQMATKDVIAVIFDNSEQRLRWIMDRAEAPFAAENKRKDIWRKR